jgi:hypothetical protein
MSQTVQINVTTGNEAVQTIKNIFQKSTGAQRVQAEVLGEYFLAASSGVRACNFDIQVNYGSAVAASGTIVFSGVSTATDTILINGVTLTAVASGAANNQWNVKGTAALQAAEVIRAINASTTALVSGTVVASLTSTATVKLTAAQAVGGVVVALPGVLGNAVSIAKGTDVGSVMTVSGARLTGGVASAANVYRFGV